jgi:hypothetical protein
VMVILPNLVQQLDFVERRVHRSSRWSHYDQNYAFTTGINVSSIFLS